MGLPDSAKQFVTIRALIVASEASSTACVTVGYENGNEDGAKMVTGRVDTKLAESNDVVSELRGFAKQG